MQPRLVWWQLARGSSCLRPFQFVCTADCGCASTNTLQSGGGVPVETAWRITLRYISVFLLKPTAERKIWKNDKLLFVSTTANFTICCCFLFKSTVILLGCVHGWNCDTCEDNMNQQQQTRVVYFKFNDSINWVCTNNYYTTSSPTILSTTP